jgi:predicted RNA-binding Zn-ribbon protein involved in translation (DUF1610 family)
MSSKEQRKTNSVDNLSKLKASLDKNKQQIKPTEQEYTVELERKEAYIDPTTRNLLRKLLESGEHEEVIPLYQPGIGFAYKSNNAESKDITKSFLDNLVRLDILEKKFYESVSVCPYCQSTTITMHNKCPKCKSHNIDKTSLTEHITCGNIDQKNNYLENRCPKCGELLLEGQYRNMGRWYVCRECGEKFENLELELICRNCGKNFSTRESSLAEFPKYAINKLRTKEIRQNVASLGDINKIFTELGFSVEVPGLAVGQKSGMEHHFSLIARKQVNQQNLTIALDHATSESEVQSQPLILYIYKTSEVTVDLPIFVAIPKLSETAKKIAEGHNILVIEGFIGEQKIYEDIKNRVKERINEHALQNDKQNLVVQNKFKGINRLKSLIKER